MWSILEAMVYKNEKEIEDVGDEDDDHLRQAEVVLQWGDQGSHRLPPQLLKSFSDSLLFFYAGLASQLIQLKCSIQTSK